MDENFKTVLDALEEAGIDVAKAEFSITEYSLNTELSFKFKNLKELLKFLEVKPDSERAHSLKALIVDSGVDPDRFFYVNFYKPKVVEL